MSSIQDAMKKKASEICGPVEYEIDKFLDNNYKSSFNMVKYLTKLDLKPRMVKLVQREFYPLLEELQSTDEDYVEAYNFMTKAQKNKFIAFVQQIINQCDEYLIKNDAKFKAERQNNKLKREMRKRHADRIAEIEKGTGYRKRK
jgi:hypothetical protein